MECGFTRPARFWKPGRSETRILVSPNNVKVFVEANVDLLSNPIKTKFLSKNARIAVEQFDWQEVKHQWHTVL